MIEGILHDVNVILQRCSSKELQEGCIKRHLSTEEVETLEEIMKQYGMDYTCDFAELQRDVHIDMSADIFEIK